MWIGRVSHLVYRYASLDHRACGTCRRNLGNVTRVTSREQTSRRASAQKTSTANTAKITPPGSRTRWGAMSRAQIVDAATKVVEAGGYGDMTIRSLAAELGVAPMSLYRHVRDKDDLLDEVVERLLARSWKPRADERDCVRSGGQGGGEAVHLPNRPARGAARLPEPPRRDTVGNRPHASHD